MQFLCIRQLKASYISYYSWIVRKYFPIFFFSFQGSTAHMQLAKVQNKTFTMLGGCTMNADIRMTFWFEQFFLFFCSLFIIFFFVSLFFLLVFSFLFDVYSIVLHLLFLFQYHLCLISFLILYNEFLVQLYRFPSSCL